MNGHYPSDKILKGSFYILISVFMIVAMNACAKSLGNNFHPMTLVLFRNVIVFVLLCGYFTLYRQWGLIKTTRLKPHIFRGVIGTIGIAIGFKAVALLPLADATTLIYTAPIFATILSIPMLKEKVGYKRWLAVLIGFIGVIIIAKPSGQSLLLLGIICALSAAFLNAMVQIYLRDLGQTEHALTTVFYFMLVGIIICLCVQPFLDKPLGIPSIEENWLILALGLSGGIQQILKTQGYALVPTSIAAPLNYTGLIWATILGWIFWDSLPQWSLAIGAFLIIGSNALIIWRENLKKKNLNSL